MTSNDKVSKRMILLLVLGFATISSGHQYEETICSTVDQSHDTGDNSPSQCPDPDTSSTEEPVLICPSTSVVAEYGKSLILKCGTKQNSSGSVEWLFVSSDTCEDVILCQFKTSNPCKWGKKYRHQVCPLSDPLSGDFSLEISPQLAQKGGRYLCTTLTGAKRYTCAVNVIAVENNTSLGNQRQDPALSPTKKPVGPREGNTTSNGINPTDEPKNQGLSQTILIVLYVGGAILLILLIVGVIFAIKKYGWSIYEKLRCRRTNQQPANGDVPEEVPLADLHLNV